MADVVLLRSDRPLTELQADILGALGRGAGVDLLVESKLARILPGVVREIVAGGLPRRAALFPRIAALLLLLRKMNRTVRVRDVAGERAVVLEIR